MPETDSCWNSITVRQRNCVIHCQAFSLIILSWKECFTLPWTAVKLITKSSDVLVSSLIQAKGSEAGNVYKWFPSTEEGDKNNYDNSPKTFVECFILKWSIPKKKAVPEWGGGGGRSRENPAPCRYLPRKSNIAAKMSTSSFRVPEVFGSPSCGRASFWRKGVQNWKTGLGQEHKNLRILKTWIYMWNYRQL